MITFICEILSVSHGRVFQPGIGTLNGGFVWEYPVDKIIISKSSVIEKIIRRFIQYG
jgi:hypothetical protein